MNYEPQKFFIGLMDFFSILLPGALLTYLLMDKMGPVVLGYDRYQELTEAKGVAAFLVASYLVGHLVFLLSSWLDLPYDWLRHRSSNKQIIRLAHRGTLSPWFVRALCWIVFKQEQDLAVNCAGKIKEQALKPLQAQNAVNTFQWSKALLAQEHPDGLATVQRFEADSKFFRCFTVVLLLLLAEWPWQHRWPVEGVSVVLLMLPLALWRYMEQRYKATNQAYWSVITLTAKDGKVALDKTDHTVASPSHAGGVVYRMRGGQAEYLLVEAKDDPNQWVLPKGHIEVGEDPRITAAREVHEETGVWARIHEECGCVSLPVSRNGGECLFYLMEKTGCGLREDNFREHRWFSLREAVKQASYLETRELLRVAEQRVARLVSRQSHRSSPSRCLYRSRRILRLIVKGSGPRGGVPK
ncbi:MAG: NUDIX domain-containing protein [Nitrospirota bacterium]